MYSCIKKLEKKSSLFDSFTDKYTAKSKSVTEGFCCLERNLIALQWIYFWSLKLLSLPAILSENRNHSLRGYYNILFIVYKLRLIPILPWKLTCHLCFYETWSHLMHTNYWSLSLPPCLYKSSILLYRQLCHPSKAGNNWFLLWYFDSKPKAWLRCIQRHSNENHIS